MADSTEQTFVVTIRPKAGDPYTADDIAAALRYRYSYTLAEIRVTSGEAPPAPLTVADVLRWPLDPNGPNA